MKAITSSPSTPLKIKPYDKPALPTDSPISLSSRSDDISDNKPDIIELDSDEDVKPTPSKKKGSKAGAGSKGSPNRAAARGWTSEELLAVWRHALANGTSGTGSNKVFEAVVEGRTGSSAREAWKRILPAIEHMLIEKGGGA